MTWKEEWRSYVGISTRRLGTHESNLYIEKPKRCGYIPYKVRDPRQKQKKPKKTYSKGRTASAAAIASVRPLLGDLWMLIFGDVRPWWCWSLLMSILGCLDAESGCRERNPTLGPRCRIVNKDAGKIRPFYIFQHTDSDFSTSLTCRNDQFGSVLWFSV